LIRAVAGYGPAAIGIDGLYTSPEQLLSEQLVEDVGSYLSKRPGDGDPASALLRRVQAETSGDAALVAAIAEAGNVVLAMHLADDRGPLPADPALARGRYGQEMVGRHQPSSTDRGALSLPQFNAAARALGVITIYEDDDHTVREMLFARRVGDAVYGPLVVPLLALQQGVSQAETAYLPDARRVQVGALRVPLTRWDGLLLNFRGPVGSFPQVSAADVVAGRIDPEQLRGKIALIGVTYFAHDTVRTPFGGDVPGVELHATAIDTILAGDALVRSSPWVDALACLLSGLVSRCCSPARGSGPARASPACWWSRPSTSASRGACSSASSAGTAWSGRSSPSPRRRRPCSRWPTSARRCSASACAGPSPTTSAPSCSPSCSPTRACSISAGRGAS
jgi:CHASE2 domain-containing sensor protein